MEIFLIIIVIVLAIVALKLFSMLFSAIGKILLVAVLVLVVYAVFAHAAKDLVYSGYIFSDQSITVDEKPFIISFPGQDTMHPSSIQLNYYSSYFFVNEGSCDTITNLEFCFVGSIYDTNAGKFKVNLSVYEVKPELAVTRVMDNAPLRVGDEAEISVNVTNGIGIPAENFQFIDSFSPEEFELEGVSGDCSKEGNNVVYRGTLRENSRMKCKYDIKALSDVERSSKAKISYFDGVEMKNIFSGAINFNVKAAFSVRTYFNESDRKVREGDKVLFIINMSNSNLDEDVEDIKMNISLPSGLSYEGTGFIGQYYNSTLNRTLQSQPVSIKSSNLLQFTGTIGKNSSRFIALKLVATRTGISNILIDTSYSFEGSMHSGETKDTLEAEHNEIFVFTNFEDGERFDSGEQKLFKIGVSNPNDNIVLNNINVSVNTTLAQIGSGFAESLKELNAVTLISQQATLPSVDRDATYPLNVVVSYDTEYGGHFTETFDYELSVDAIAGLSISHGISKTSVESGEEFTVSSIVKNERNMDIKNVRVFDVVPMEFQRTGLNSVSNLDINANDAVTAYQYRMTAPEVAVPTLYSFRTTARYERGNKTYAFENAYQITVSPRKLDLSITRVISDPTPYKGAIIDVLYTITNPDDDITLNNINLFFPIQDTMDLVGQMNFTISQLLPGESYTIKDVHRIRPKENGSVMLEPTIFVYRDENRNVFTKNSSPNSFSAEPGYISGPAFIVEKDSNASVDVGDYVSLMITVANIGSEAGDIKITDSENSWNLQMEPDEKDFITYKTKAEKAGRIYFKPAFAEYAYRGKPVYTISNSVYTDVNEKKEEAVTEKPQEIKEVKIEKVKEVPVQKTFLQIVWEAIRSVFSVLG